MSDRQNLSRLLLAEDDPLLGDGLCAGLRLQGFAVDWVRDGQAAEQELRTFAYDAAVLDLSLPIQDGLTTISRLRNSAIPVPILVLTARDTVLERIHGLELGADDYVMKPIDLKELAARLRALIRRSKGFKRIVLQSADVSLDIEARVISKAGVAIPLSTREFDLLYALMSNSGRVMSREQLEQKLYNWGQEVDSNAVEVHIHHLRKKLGSSLIQTIRGIGYLIRKERQGE